MQHTSLAEIRIRPLTRADIPHGMRLKSLAGWNQTEADWERFLALSPEGSFAAEKDGEVIGTACTFVFGSVGWIAMILVDPEHRRHRLGSSLFQTSLDFLRTKHLTAIKLDATPAGKEVYLRFGFQEEYSLERRRGISIGGKSQSVIFMNEADLAGVFEMDLKIYGADRSGLLERLFSEGAKSGFAGVVPGKTKEAPRGFAFIRPGSGSSFIGPIIAESPEVGAELFEWALTRTKGNSVVFDLPHPNEAVMAWTSGAGLLSKFPVERPFTRMFLGDNIPGHPEKIYATSGSEKG